MYVSEIQSFFQSINIKEKKNRIQTIIFAFLYYVNSIFLWGDGGMDRLHVSIQVHLHLRGEVAEVALV